MRDVLQTRIDAEKEKIDRLHYKIIDPNARLLHFFSPRHTGGGCPISTLLGNTAQCLRN
jgi:hypothetical protein